MIFFYLGYWWFTRGRPYVQRLAIGLIVEALRVTAIVVLFPLGNGFIEPGNIVLSYVLHLVAVAAFLALMHFSGKAIDARKARRTQQSAEVTSGFTPAPPPQPSRLELEPSPTNPRRKRRRKWMLPAALGAAVGLAATLGIFWPSTAELYDERQRAEIEWESALDDQLGQPLWMRESCDSDRAAYFDALEPEDGALADATANEAWQNTIAALPPEASAAFEEATVFLEAEKARCRSTLSDADFAPRSAREGEALAARLNRSWYLIGELMLIRNSRSFCTTGFGEIDCSKLLPNLGLHRACYATNAKASPCKEKWAAAEAKIVSVLQCEAEVGAYVWGEEASIDDATIYREHVATCAEPRERTEAAGKWATRSDELLQQHVKFVALVAAGVSALFALLGQFLATFLHKRGP